ncbi:MAG TPA: ABC transporter ATP-binding protein [Acidimicrobiales bacterium]|nr:ABC transporter ATP-binding protein [Acidimicrobiales bacterium]
MSEGRGEPILEVRGVTKTFPGVVANEDVDLTLHRGQVLCLLGENGAGKSTLVNVVFGLYQPDGGEILLRGEPVHFASSREAIKAGIGMVHQHFQLIPVFTVVENVVLGDEIRKGPMLDLDTARERIRDLGRRYGLVIDPDAIVGELSVGEQQRVELIKALFRDAEVLILDEPTAVLTPGEVDEFFGVVRNLVEQGKSIIFITHKLREVLSVADQIVVLRGGKVVGEADPKEATQQSLATLMVGRDVSFTIDKTPATPGEVVLRAEGLTVDDDRGVTTVSGFDLEVRAGEIFGIAGVEGNGQRELVEALMGMRVKRGGTVEITGQDVTHASPRDIIELGVGHVPEDRTKHGLVGPFTIADNLVLNQYRNSPFAHRGLRRDDAIATYAGELVEQFDIRTPSPQVAVETLSGGNQQKVIIARELQGVDKLLVVAQPTRGLDVGSIEFIHRRIVEMRDQGAAVLLVSAELDEVLNLSDRIGVIYRGALVGTFDRADATRDRLGLLMASGADPEVAA